MQFSYRGGTHEFVRFSGANALILPASPLAAQLSPIFPFPAVSFSVPLAISFTRRAF